MKFKEVLEKKADDLDLLEKKMREELALLSMKLRMGQLAQSTKIGALRRDIARVLTARCQKGRAPGRQAL